MTTHHEDYSTKGKELFSRVFNKSKSWSCERQDLQWNCENISAILYNCVGWLDLIRLSLLDREGNKLKTLTSIYHLKKALSGKKTKHDWGKNQRPTCKRRSRCCRASSQSLPGRCTEALIQPDFDSDYFIFLNKTFHIFQKVHWSSELAWIAVIMII